ncbi:hypothetical protein EDD92_9288 [Streptomyces sp. TLI_185]|nr:hypothetical protein EDD92_9288 [Streptomyces sp. TLI_185]
MLDFIRDGHTAQTGRVRHHLGNAVVTTMNPATAEVRAYLVQTRNTGESIKMISTWVYTFGLRRPAVGGGSCAASLVPGLAAHRHGAAMRDQSQLAAAERAPWLADEVGSRAGRAGSSAYARGATAHSRWYSPPCPRPIRPAAGPPPPAGRSPSGPPWDRRRSEPCWT